MSSRTSLKRIAADPTEKVHISFLKWALGVNRRTSNVAVWKLAGRQPLALDRIRHTLSFLKRLQTMDSSCLAKRALTEQERYHLPWFKSILPLLQLDEIYRLPHMDAARIIRDPKAVPPPPPNPVASPDPPLASGWFRPWKVNNILSCAFRSCLDEAANSQSKLSFFKRVILDFSPAKYLHTVSNYGNRTALNRFLTSSHHLAIERGRYSSIPRDKRICSWCNGIGLSLVEDEEHLLFTCLQYITPRIKMSDDLRKHGLAIPNSTDDLTHTLNHPIASNILAQYVNTSLTLRGQGDSLQEGAPSHP